MTNQTLSEALRWLALGIAPFPIFRRDKRPCFEWTPYQTRLPEIDQVFYWFDHRFRNLAIITGHQGLVVLDFDSMDAYELWRMWAISQEGIAALVADMGYQVRTARGRHVYVSLTNPPAGSLKLGSVDVKANGYVLTFPSIHPSGIRYEPVDPAAPILRAQSLADVLPPELIALHDVTLVQAVLVPRVERLVDDPWLAAASPSRILDEESPLEVIRTQHSILEMFPGAVRRGRKLWAKCILHHDTNPSVEIVLDRNRAKCWAGCTKGHYWDYTDFYAAIHRLTLRQAMQLLVN